jgi:hypothetical protein
MFMNSRTKRQNISVNAINIAEKIERGRDVLYNSGHGLHVVAMALLEANEDAEVSEAMGHREAIIKARDGLTVYELYATQSGGLAIKETLGLVRINPEGWTLTVPHEAISFVSMEHTLRRARTGSGANLYAPPTQTIAGIAFMNPNDQTGMNEYLDQYLPVAETMRHQLMKEL